MFVLLLLWLPIGSANRILQAPSSSLIRRTQAVTNCPDADGVSLDLPNGSTFVKIRRSSSLCTLVEVKSMGGEQFLKPIGRSYSDKDWERVAGEYSTSIMFDCDGAGCSVNLPPAPSGSVYQLTTLVTPDYSEQDIAARFLEQTTFGPTQETIAELLSISNNPRVAMAQWMREQQQMDYLSHRAIVRTRLNSKFKVPNPMGAVTQPCRAGTRYRKSLFSIKHIEQPVEFRFTNGVLLLGFDGHPYTVVAPQVYTFDGELVPLEWESGLYTVCFVAEDIYVAINHPVHGECTLVIFQSVENADIFEANPSIRFAAGITPNPQNVMDLPAGSFELTDQEYFEYVIEDEDIPTDREMILLQDIDDSNCASKVFPKDYGGEPVFGLTADGTYWLHDPRFDLEENTLETPLADASNYAENADALNRDFGVLCPTAPRTFLNEDTCIISNSPNACSADRTLYGEDQVEGNFPEVLVQMTLEAMQAVYTATGGGAPGTRYWYVIDGLDITQDQRAPKPCQREETSRWRPITCTGSAATVNVQVRNIFRQLIDFFKVEPGDDEYNPNLLEVWYPRVDDFEPSCPASLMDFAGFEVEDSDGDCWLNTHPDNLNVYDFTYWTTAHPGNTAERNPIKEFAESSSFTLQYPASHDLLRWQSRKEEFLGPVRLGEYFNFYDLPNEIRTEAIAAALQIDLDTLSNEGLLASSGEGTLVCGSPHEVANDPFTGGNAERGAFDAATSEFQTSFFFLNKQRRIAWLIAAMEDSAQLRQRVSWALAQLLVISPSGITDGFTLTEAFMSYYDIFVRNAFGNYRQILKEVAYSPMMADMLTFYEGRSTAFVFEEEGNIEFADENFAREVCQLFTTGLFSLNQDGTKVIGSDGLPVRVYTNDEIQEYARAWTGFTNQHARGNIETTYGDNRVDPMRVNESWRDKFPKMGLNGKYIGDGYPLCVDLPDQHFLKQGATYRLLGNNALPDHVRDPANWSEDSSARLRLDPSSGLFTSLCGNGDTCEASSTVVLQSDVACNGLECDVGSVRSVQVADNIFYEYVRPPCVHLAFYEGGRSMSRQWEDDKVMCGNPLDNPAVLSCCDIPNFQARWSGVYYGERATYLSAATRCESSETLCSREVRPSCDEDEPDVGTRCYGNHYFWTDDSCALQVKIKSDGRVAVVHRPEGLSEEFVASHVASTTQTFFRVHWDGDYQSLLSDCETQNACYVSSDGMCICGVTVEEGTLQNPSDILNQLFIGAFPEETEDVFETIDAFGILQRRKNTRSTVRIDGTNISFRNPPHFVSLSDEEPRDAHYETDATLDQYFFHPNVAPFLAVRFAQRFGVSNPSPGFIERIASAFRSGSFSSHSVSFGTGKYGDMSAMIAALLLDDEARDTALDADPSHGSLREPILKVIAMMRAFKLEKKPGVPFLQFGNFFYEQIGQEPHRIPNVFSFFLPEYQTPGPIQQAGLTAPEGQVLTSPRIIDTVNGLLSLSKWGLSDCFGGFGTETDCRYTDNFSFQQDADRIRSLAAASFSDVVESTDPAAMVDELATLMTAGRLSRYARDTIVEVVSSAPTATALDYARQLIVTTPEYHSTGTVRHQESERPPLETQSSGSAVPYKAVVYVMLDGGMDSFNMLAPHTCSTRNAQGQTLREQYEGERTSIAMSDSERTRIISAQGQPCSEFAIHQNLPVVERLYNDGDLAFFANIGVLDEPVTKESFFRTTELFAHNIMQDALQRIDPWSVSAGTGILGRTSDRLADKGFSVQPITIEDASVATVGFPGQAIPPIVLSSQGLNRFNPGPAGEPLNVTQYVGALNGQTELHSSLFGETWSRQFQKASVDSNLLVTALENAVLTQSYNTETEYMSKMKAVSSIILTRDARGSERDVIFVRLGGWDHHQGLKANLATEFDLLNEGFEVFEAEMKAQGLWDQVNVVVASDFARTLTANSGEGSDHAWGGNTFMFGGDVKGNAVYGDYPDDITPDSRLNIGRGRLIPTSSWETMLNPVVGWLGLDTEDDLNYAMPNRIRAGARLYGADEIFENIPSSGGGGGGSDGGLLEAFLAVLTQILALILAIFS